MALNRNSIEEKQKARAEVDDETLKGLMNTSMANFEEENRKKLALFLEAINTRTLINSTKPAAKKLGLVIEYILTGTKTSQSTDISGEKLATLYNNALKECGNPKKQGWLVTNGIKPSNVAVQLLNAHERVQGLLNKQELTATQKFTLPNKQ